MQIYAREIHTTKSCIFKIPQTGLSVQTTVMIFFPKIQLEIPFIRCIWDSNQMSKGHWKCMGKKTQRKVVFFTSNIFAV